MRDFGKGGRCAPYGRFVRRGFFGGDKASLCLVTAKNRPAESRTWRTPRHTKPARLSKTAPDLTLRFPAVRRDAKNPGFLYILRKKDRVSV
jgi:hypothetical protein